MGNFRRLDLMEEGGWVLRSLTGSSDYAPYSCWAEHGCVATEHVRNGNGMAVYGWYPRDNAYFGACCYCGAGCPEGIIGAYLMLNLEVLHKWKPRRWARRGPKEVLDHG